MERPHKDITQKELLDLYKQRVFYHILKHSKGQGVLKAKPCILSRNSAWNPLHPMVTYFDEDMRLCEGSDKYAEWQDLYDGWEEADKFVKHIDKLYTKGFWRRPYVTIDTLEKYKGEMVKIEKRINEELKEYPNFLGIDFCDVSAYGIQVRGHHKQILTHTFGKQPTINYDFTNKEQVIQDFVQMWKVNDTPEDVIRYKDFIYFGNKYGLD